MASAHHDLGQFLGLFENPFRTVRRVRMDRRNFTMIMGAVVAGMVAGSKLSADEKKAEDKDKKDAHSCKGKNDCKGKGGCKSGDGGCAGKNSCKGKGGCAVPHKDDKKS
ncbi:MAG TPA: hypothetical protein VN375_15070 [Vicinamibacteria bacterium]|nr:hypothetical protein [Vicinamibacteria bacterium]